MRSIKARFMRIQNRRLDNGSVINFASAVRGQKFKEQYISRSFNILVDKDDYDKRDKKTLLKHLEHLSSDH